MSAIITLKAEMDMTTGLPSDKLLPETIDHLKRTLKINLLLFTDSVNVFVDKWVALGSKAIQKLLEVVPEHQE